jgi:hypothetical protein
VRPAVALSICVAALLAVATAVAAPPGNPLNSDEKPPSSPGAQPPVAKSEVTIVPAVGGSTDTGVSVGYFAGVTRNLKGAVPYVWNLESAGLISFAAANGAFEIPLIDVYAKLTVPRLLERPLTLELRPSFTDERTLYYYGMGNASSATPPPGQSTTYFQYGRLHPSLLADVRFKLVGHLGGLAGMRYTASWYDVPAGSMLASDLRNGSAEVRALIGPTSPTSVALFIYGLQFDTRDSEVSPHKGTFDEAKISFSPGGAEPFAFRYGEARINVRGYVPAGKRVTLAGRIVGQVLFGDVPFAELPRFEDTYFGGGYGLRGVPAQRYYGKVKLFGNLEVRAKLLDFKAFSKPLILGAAAFFDGGRVWADTSPHPELDGTGLGLKYGIGAGARIQSGSAFVIRADVAWSPDATPIGAYVAAGEMF